jgi:hypothetical protein
MRKSFTILNLLLLLAITACNKTETPIPVEDTTFEVKFSSDGMEEVDAQFGISEKSQLDPTWSGDILTGKLDASVKAAGQLTGTGKYRKGDKVYAYVRFNDITNPANLPPAGNGFLAAAIYINNNAYEAVRLGYYDYYNKPQQRYVDAKGKTNLLLEKVFVIQ